MFFNHRHMTTLFYLVIAINVLSILFLILTLSRLRKYVSKNAFQESKYTLLFGFVPLEGYIYAYVISVLAFGMFFWFIVV